MIYVNIFRPVAVDKALYMHAVKLSGEFTEEGPN